MVSRYNDTLFSALAAVVATTEKFEEAAPPQRLTKIWQRLR